MTWVNRLSKIFPGFGVPVSNDTLFQSVGNSLSGTSQAAVALTSLSPTLSCGWIRVKIYQFGGTSPTLLSLVVNVTDGVEVVCVNQTIPVVASVPANALTLTDGAMSSASAVLTSATGAFVSGLVGRQISVSKAGNAGGTAALLSTVITYTSATSITLANATLQTGGTSSATITFPPYSNIGVKTAGSLSQSGYDILIPFEVDINVSEVDVNYTLGGTSPTAKMDLEVGGTS